MTVRIADSNTSDEENGDYTSSGSLSETPTLRDESNNSESIDVKSVISVLLLGKFWVAWLSERVSSWFGKKKKKKKHEKTPPVY